MRALLRLVQFAVIGAVGCSPTRAEEVTTRTSAVTVQPELPIAPTLAGDPLATHTGSRAVWTGTHFVVFSALNNYISAARVDAAGNALDVPARKIGYFRNRVRNFRVASGATGMLVAVTSESGAAAFRTVFVAPDLTPSSVREQFVKEHCADVAVAALGARFLVACTNDYIRAVIALRIGSDNIALESVPLTLTDPSTDYFRWPSVATDGTSWLVTWVEGTASGLQLESAQVTADGAIARRGRLPWFSSGHGATSTWHPAAAEYRVAAGGNIVRLSREGLFLGASPGPMAAGDIQLWSAGTELHATWHRDGELRDTTVATNGAVASTVGTSVAKVADAPYAIAASPTQALVTFHASALRTSTSAVALDSAPRTVLFGSREQYLVGSHFDGTSFQVSFRDGVGYGEGAGDLVRAITVAPGATSLGAPFDVFADVPVGEVRVTFDGSAHVLARGGGWGTRVERRNTLDGPPISATTIGAYTVKPWGIASSGGVTLVGTCADACGLTRIDASGAKLDASPIPAGRGTAIAGAGGKFLVMLTGLYGDNAVYRVSAAGKIEDSAPRGLEGARWASVTSDGARFIAAYDAMPGVAMRAIPLDGWSTATTLLDSSGAQPVLASDGHRTLVAWTGPLSGDELKRTVLGQVLGPDLRPVHAKPFVIAPEADFAAAVAAAPSGRFLVALARRDHTFHQRLSVVPVTVGALIGDPCSTTKDCETGVCVDGVCCESACSGQCEACDVPAAIGKCTAVFGPPRGIRAACAPPAGECGARCDGARRDECSFPSATTACSRYACESGVETHESTCDGAGACLDVPRACGAFACGATACHTTCTTDGACATGHRCEDGVCVPGALGTKCSSDAECASGFCTDGVCCASRCDGVCEACDAPSAAGSCVAVRGAPHAARPACPSDSTDPCRQMVCDGSARATCSAFVGGEVVCSEATCRDGAIHAASRCDGTGACPGAATTACVSGVCADDGRTCQSEPEPRAGCGCNTSARTPLGFALSVALAVATAVRRRRTRAALRRMASVQHLISGGASREA